MSAPWPHGPGPTAPGGPTGPGRNDTQPTPHVPPDGTPPPSGPPPGPTPTGPGRLLRPAETAAAFGVSYPTLWLWSKTGRIGFIRTPGGQHRYRESEVRALLAAGYRARGAR